MLSEMDASKMQLSKLDLQESRLQESKLSKPAPISLKPASHLNKYAAGKTSFQWHCKETYMKIFLESFFIR